MNGETLNSGEGWYFQKFRLSLRNIIYIILRQKSILLCLFICRRYLPVIICSLSLSICLFNLLFQLVLSWMFFLETFEEIRRLTSEESPQVLLHFTLLAVWLSWNSCLCTLFYGTLSTILDSSLDRMDEKFYYYEFCFDKTFIRLHFT